MRRGHAQRCCGHAGAPSGHAATHASGSALRCPGPPLRIGTNIPASKWSTIWGTARSARAWSKGHLRRPSSIDAPRPPRCGGVGSSRPGPLSRACRAGAHGVGSVDRGRVSRPHLCVAHRSDHTLRADDRTRLRLLCSARAERHVSSLNSHVLHCRVVSRVLTLTTVSVTDHMTSRT